MDAELLNLGTLGIIFCFFLKEFFAYLKTKKIEKTTDNGDYKVELAAINNKLGNHLTEVNGKIGDIEREMTYMNIDIKIIKETINDIKIALKK